MKTFVLIFQKHEERKMKIKIRIKTIKFSFKISYKAFEQRPLEYEKVIRRRIRRRNHIMLYYMQGGD